MVVTEALLSSLHLNHMMENPYPLRPTAMPVGRQLTHCNASRRTAHPLQCLSEDSSPIGLTPLFRLPPSVKSNDGGTPYVPAVSAVASSSCPPKSWSPKSGARSFFSFVKSRALFQYCYEAEIPHFFPNETCLGLPSL